VLDRMTLIDAVRQTVGIHERDPVRAAPHAQS
jgi:hypothetical protein